MSCSSLCKVSAFMCRLPHAHCPLQMLRARADGLMRRGAAQDIDPQDLFPPVQYRIAEDDDVDMPYKVPDSDGKGSPGELQNIQAARRALKRFRSDLGSKRGADAVRVRGVFLSLCFMGLVVPFCQGSLEGTFMSFGIQG